VLRIAVVGASGYSGAEAAALLSLHPEVELAALCASASAGSRFEDLHPGKAHLVQGELQPFDAAALAGLDAVFLALPHGVSANAAAELHGKVGRVIDLSGDLRLPNEASYERWYGQAHPAPQLLGQAAYGLPELFGCALPAADLVACAGCYPTVSQLAAAPALRAGAGSSVVVSASSGTSGAGRKADLALSFTELEGDVRAYRVGRHQHAPEIAQGLTRHAERPVTVTFVPHLIPIGRGISAAVVMPNEAELSQAAVLEAYREAYATAPFVRVLDPAQRMPSVKAVARTNFCELAPVVDEAGGTIVVSGAIDNLGKGAAGQAVQVFNVCFGLDETLGLLPARTGVA
jgi:N-acetyl-gamma-glutamyl-phosphate reductase